MDKIWLADEKGLREVDGVPIDATLLYVHDDGEDMYLLYAKTRKGAYRVRRVTVHSHREFSPRVFAVTTKQANDVVFRSCNKSVAGTVVSTLNAVLGHERKGAEKIVKQLVWKFFGG